MWQKISNFLANVDWIKVANAAAIVGLGSEHSNCCWLKRNSSS